MKRRKRTSDDDSLPVVTKRPDGKYAVEVAKGSGCYVTFWCEHDGDEQHVFVQLHGPDDVLIQQVRDGGVFTTLSRH